MRGAGSAAENVKGTGIGLAMVDAIAAGVDSIMVEHELVPVLDPDPHRPASISPAVIQGTLRRELGFQAGAAQAAASGDGGQGGERGAPAAR